MSLTDGMVQLSGLGYVDIATLDFDRLAPDHVAEMSKAFANNPDLMSFVSDEQRGFLTKEKVENIRKTGASSYGQLLVKTKGKRKKKGDKTVKQQYKSSSKNSRKACRNITDSPVKLNNYTVVEVNHAGKIKEIPMGNIDELCTAKLGEGFELIVTNTDVIIAINPRAKKKSFVPEVSKYIKNIIPEGTVSSSRQCIIYRYQDSFTKSELLSINSE